MQDSTPSDHQRDEFPTTQWTQIRIAQNPDGDLPVEVERDALGKICTSYWRPVFVFLLKSGKKPHEAEDLTQGFFHHFLKNDLLYKAKVERGRLRSFLLAALQQYLTQEWRKSSALKRGGGKKVLSLNQFANVSAEVGEVDSAEDLYDRAWAEQMFLRAVAQLREGYRQRGKDELLESLLPHLGEYNEPGADMEALARRLGMDLSTLRVNLHRMRKRLGETLKEEVRSQMIEGDEVEEELRYLLSMMG